MLATQLDLFGAPPKPPAKIRVDEEDTKTVTEDASAIMPPPAEEPAVPVVEAKVPAAPAVQEPPVQENRVSAVGAIHVLMPAGASNTAPVVGVGKATALAVQMPTGISTTRPVPLETPTTEIPAPAEIPADIDAAFEEAVADAEEQAVPQEAALPEASDEAVLEAAIATEAEEIPTEAEAPPTAMETMPSEAEAFALEAEATALEMEQAHVEEEVLPTDEATPTIETEGALQDEELPAEEVEAEVDTLTVVQDEDEHIYQLAPAADSPVADTQEAKEETAAMGVPEDEILFKRQYYTMRETAGMLGLSQSLLRYWESEFTILKPRKNRKGDRYFRPEDIKNLQLIYHLLKVRKFTMEGAREYLKNQRKALDNFEMVQRLERIKHFLQELKTNG